MKTSKQQLRAEYKELCIAWNDAQNNFAEIANGNNEKLKKTMKALIIKAEKDMSACDDKLCNI